MMQLQHRELNFKILQISRVCIKTFECGSWNKISTRIIFQNIKIRIIHSEVSILNSYKLLIVFTPCSQWVRRDLEVRKYTNDKKEILVLKFTRRHHPKIPVGCVSPAFVARGYTFPQIPYSPPIPPPGYPTPPFGYTLPPLKGHWTRDTLSPEET